MDPRRVVSVILGDDSDDDLDGSDEEVEDSFRAYSRLSYEQSKTAETGGSSNPAPIRDRHRSESFQQRKRRR